MGLLAIGYLVGLFSALIPSWVMRKREERQRAGLEKRMERERETARSLETEKAYAAGRNDQAAQDQAAIAGLQQRVDLLTDENDDLRSQLRADTIFANQVAHGRGTVILRKAGGPG